MTAEEYLENIALYPKDGFVDKKEALEAVEMAKRDALKLLWHQGTDRPSDHAFVLARDHHGTYHIGYYRKMQDWVTVSNVPWSVISYWCLVGEIDPNYF